MRMGTGESPGDKRRPTSERGGPLILLIEDDAWIRAFMRDAITDAGYRVIEAADGRTGMRLASEQPPDLVLLDLAMPGITGVDVLHELKRQATTQNVSVVVLSAFPQVLSERDACSVAGVLAKPVDVTTLLERIHDAVPNETVDDSTGAAPHRGVPCSA